MEKPQRKPNSPNFSTGPTRKRPGWSTDVLSAAITGRSHRSKPAKARLKQAIDLTREVARIPDSHRIGILPGSDTGAFEGAMWSLLGQRPVTVLAWESFGSGWVTDVTKQLKVESKVIMADYGKIPDLDQVDWDTDVIFTWNGTTSGVCVPQGFSPPAERKGLALCDGTSAVFAMNLPWENLDVVTFSWQKCLGSEAAHGVSVISPRTVERLESFTPSWPLPKVFRLTKGGKLDQGIWEGSTINTPSMLCVEDYIDALTWAKTYSFEGQTGLDALVAKSRKNLANMNAFVEQNDWIEFLAEAPECRSSTALCLKIVADWFVQLPTDEQSAFCKKIVSTLDAEGVANDFGPYKDAPPGFRFWGGPTVNPDDTTAVLGWLAWAYASQKPG